jgi:hypothetical protein
MFWVALLLYCLMMLFGLFLTLVAVVVAVLGFVSILPPSVQRLLEVKLF